MGTVNIFPLDDMKNTPFSFEKGIEHLNNNGVFITSDEREADMYVTRFFPIKNKWEQITWLLRHRYIPILVWTDEPRFCTLTQTYFKSKPYIPSIHIMNCYTGDVLINPWCVFGYWAITKKLEYISDDCTDNKKMICSMGSYRNEPLILYNKNIDLTDYRQKLSIYGYQKGIVDICGPNWPKMISITTNTRKVKDWHKEKLDFLQNYRFNIAIENTLIHNYITEKIWDPITVGCLPIYYGNDNIYSIFKQKSFIDTNKFNSFNSLFDYIINMTRQEYLERINSCIETYNRAFNDIDFSKEYHNMVDMIINKIRTIISK